MYLSNRYFWHDSVLREGARSHEMIQGFPLTGKPTSPVRHDSFTLCCSYLATHVGLGTNTELTFPKNVREKKTINNYIEGINV